MFRAIFRRQPQNPPVKCADCGFLSVRHLDSMALLPFSVTYRTEGNQFVDDGTSAAPYCFVREHAIHNERMEAGGSTIELIGEAPGFISLGDSAGGDVTGDAVLSVIRKERICRTFYPWKDGFTPKEHHEMRESQQWREWQAEQRRADRHWRLFELFVIGVLATLVAGGFTIIGALIERGTIQ